MDQSKHVMWRLYRRGRIYWAHRTVNGAKERKSTGHTDKRLAEAVVLSWHRGDIDPTTRAAATTLKSALVALIDERRARGRAAGTLMMHAQKSAALLDVLGERITLDRVDAAAVDRYIEARLAARVTRSTIGKELSTLRGALRLARRRGLYHMDHGQVMPIGWSNEYEPRTRHLTPIELPRLLAELQRSGRAAHVAFIVATGLRWGESLRAERADVDLTTWTVVPRGTKTKRSKDPVPIAPSCRGLLSLSVDGAPKKGTMFAVWHSVRRDLAAACARAKIAAVTPNDLRRTTASWLVQSGVDLFAVSKVLRHVDTRMVERVYGQVPTDALRTMLARSRPANDPRPATVTGLCLTGAISGAQRAERDDERCGNLVPRDRIELSTRGFSIQGAAGVWCEKTRGPVRRRPGDVTRLCPRRPVEMASPEWIAVHLAKAHALDGERAETWGHMVEALRVAR